MVDCFSLSKTAIFCKVAPRRILCVDKIGSWPRRILCVDKIGSRPRGILCVDKIGSVPQDRNRIENDLK